MLTFLIHVFILCFIFIILAVGCNLILGYGGMCQIGHGAFYAIGAYVAAILSTQSSIPWPLEALASMALALAVGLILAWSMVGLNADFFALATFGFAIVVFTVLMNWVSLTKGAPGIPAIPPIQLGSLQITQGGGFLALVLLLALASTGLIFLLIRSAFGRSLRAMRDDETGYVSTGRSGALMKIHAYGLGTMLAGLAGNLFAHYTTYVDPTSFNVDLSILILTMVVVGGMGTFTGPLVGAFLLVVIPELLRFVGLPGTTGGLIRQGLYGSLLVTILFFRPSGLMGGVHWDLRRAFRRGRTPASISNQEHSG